MTDYAELAAATNFSFLRGASSPQEMVLAALILGHTGIGIADRNSVAGVVRAYGTLKDARKGELPAEKIREGSGPGEYVWSIPGEVEHLRSERRDEDLRGRCFDRQLRPRDDLFALERDGFAPNETVDDRERLLRLRVRPRPGQAQHLFDEDLVGRTDAEGKPATRRILGRERLLCERYRMAPIQRHDRGAELDSGSIARNRRQRGE